MKILFLTILCGVGLSLNLATADTTTNLPNVGGKNSKSVNLVNVVNINETNNELSNLDILFEAILSKDYLLVRQIIADNKDILTNYYDTKFNKTNVKINALGYAIYSHTSEPNKQIEIIEYLRENYELDLNSICEKLIFSIENNETKSYEFYAIFMAISTGSEFELFKYLTQHKSNPYGFFGLIYATMPQAEKISDLAEIGDFKTINSYIKTDEYKNYKIRHTAAVREIFANYKYVDFGLSDIEIAGRFYILTDDDELFGELLKFGAKDDEKLMEQFHNWAKQTNAIKILKFF